jgi:hypothetical protein
MPITNPPLNDNATPALISAENIDIVFTFEKEGNSIGKERVGPCCEVDGFNVGTYAMPLTREFPFQI